MSNNQTSPAMSSTERALSHNQMPATNLDRAGLVAQLRALSEERDSTDEPNDSSLINGIPISRYEISDPTWAARHLEVLKEKCIEQWTEQSNESTNPDHKGKPEVFAAEYKFERVALEQWRIEWIAEKCSKNSDEWLRKEAKRTHLPSRSISKAKAKAPAHINEASDDEPLFIPERSRKKQRASQPDPTPTPAPIPESVPATPSHAHQSPYIPPRGPAAGWNPPLWAGSYNINSRGFDPILRGKLIPIRTFMDQYEGASDRAAPGAIAALDRIRLELHIIELLDVDEVTVGVSKLLHRNLGLPRLFAGGLHYQPDICADAEALARRWSRLDFEADIFRGIRFVRKTASLDPNYGNRQKSAGHGYGDLVNGQWWPTRLCLLRDGGHSALEAGIHGAKSGAAASVVLSHSKYEDVDNGVEVLYSGTATKAGEDSDHTKMLLASVKRRDSAGNRYPLRLFRSSKMAHGGYQPSVGIRFDGLYEAMSYEILPESGGMLQFRLLRMPGQDPIRYKGVGARPSNMEVTELKKHAQQMAGIDME